MDLYTFLGSATTVLAFLAFIAIVAWAYSSRRRKAFEEAANAPFALPDDVRDSPAGSGAKTNSNRAERQS